MAFTKAGLWGPDAVLDSAGHPQPGATAAVYLSDGVTLAGLWTTSAKSVALANPTQADIHGNLHFYADPGPYVLKVTVGGTVTTLTVEVPIDPGEAAQDQDVAAALAAAEAYADGVVAAAQAASQPLDSDLTAIAALSTTAFGRSFLALADAAAGQSLLGLGTAATQPSTAFDAAGAAATAQAASQPLDSDLTAIAALSTTAFGRSVLTRVDAAALRTLAGTVIGTDVQAHDPDLDTIAALDSSTAGALSTDGAGWIRKTYAQLKTALGLVKADVGLGNADNTSDANKPVSTAQQAALDLKVATSGPTADLPFNSHKATGLTDPTSAQDAATKAYVDAVAQGLSVKAAVRAASNTNHTLSAPGATVDGVTMVSGDRVLLRAQAAPAENGIWVWNGAAVAMTRATDADTSPEVVSGLYTFVTEGSTWASTGFALITPNPIVLDTTPLTFTPASGAGQIVAGTALTKTGNSLAVSDTELLALASLTSAADSLPYFTGSGTAALATLSAFIRSLLDDADAATARTTLGLDTAATHPATDFAASSGIAESAVTSLVTDLAAKSPILVPTAVKTGNYTAAIGDYVLCDTSGGIFTVTLPTAPADKTSIAVDLVASGNTLTIARGGADVFQKAGGPTALTMNTADRVLVLQYQSSIAVWHVQDHLPAVITTKGDLLTYGTERARLAVGADGALLGADSTQTTGLKWIPSGTYASALAPGDVAVPLGPRVSGDTTGATDLTNLTAAINALSVGSHTTFPTGPSSKLRLPAGKFYINGPLPDLQPGVSIEGQDGATTIYCIGGTVDIPFINRRDPNFVGSEGFFSRPGNCTGLTLDGTNANPGTVGYQIGDTTNGVDDIVVQNFGAIYKASTNTSPSTVVATVGGRADSGCTINSGYTTILDTAIAYADIGKTVAITGNGSVPSDSVVAELIVGVGFNIGSKSSPPVPANGVTAGTASLQVACKRTDASCTLTAGSNFIADTAAVAADLGALVIWKSGTGSLPANVVIMAVNPGVGFWIGTKAKGVRHRNSAGFQQNGKFRYQLVNNGENMVFDGAGGSNNTFEANRYDLVISARNNQYGIVFRNLAQVSKFEIDIAVGCGTNSATANNGAAWVVSEGSLIQFGELHCVAEIDGVGLAGSLGHVSWLDFNNPGGALNADGYLYFISSTAANTPSWGGSRAGVGALAPGLTGYQFAGKMCNVFNYGNIGSQVVMEAIIGHRLSSKGFVSVSGVSASILWETGNIFQATLLSGTTTISFSPTPATFLGNNMGTFFFLGLTQPATPAVLSTWFSGVTWAEGFPPPLNTNAGSITWYMFVTTDGGTTWMGRCLTPQIKVKAGTISDADFATTPTDGTTAIDSSDGRMYFRYGGAWHYVTQTA